jgi:hypothetical protein
MVSLPEATFGGIIDVTPPVDIMNVILDQGIMAITSPG